MSSALALASWRGMRPARRVLDEHLLHLRLALEHVLQHAVAAADVLGAVLGVEAVRQQRRQILLDRRQRLRRRREALAQRRPILRRALRLGDRRRNHVEREQLARQREVDATRRGATPPRQARAAESAKRSERSRIARRDDAIAPARRDGHAGLRPGQQLRRQRLSPRRALAWTRRPPTCWTRSPSSSCCSRRQGRRRPQDAVEVGLRQAGRPRRSTRRR